MEIGHHYHHLQFRISILSIHGKFLSVKKYQKYAWFVQPIKTIFNNIKTTVIITSGFFMYFRKNALQIYLKKVSVPVVEYHMHVTFKFARWFFYHFSEFKVVFSIIPVQKDCHGFNICYNFKHLQFIFRINTFDEFYFSYFFCYYLPFIFNIILYLNIKFEKSFFFNSLSFDSFRFLSSASFL